jgi:precorrin-6B methylase 2
VEPVNAHQDVASDFAAYTALLEIAQRVGLSQMLDSGASFTLADASAVTRTGQVQTASLLSALVAAGLLDPDESSSTFIASVDLAERRYQAGYLAWTLDANRIYIDHCADFMRDAENAASTYRRDGHKVALTTQWIGTKGFYPDIKNEIIRSKPDRVVDLGAGAGALAIDLLVAQPALTALALDVSGGACDAASSAARVAGVDGRLDVVRRSIESLVEDPSPLQGADVIHAAFVLHDIVKYDDVFLGVLSACRKELGDGGRLVVADAVRYASDREERAFSALFTYLHANFMGVELPSEERWIDLFERAGFRDVECRRLRTPGTRMFLAHA